MIVSDAVSALLTVTPPCTVQRKEASMFNAGKKFALALGIALIFPMTLYYGVRSFSPPHDGHFETYLFFVSVPMGIIAIIAGTLIPLQAVGTGLMFGGVLSITRGYWGYWAELPDPLRFVSLVVALIVLIVAGYKKLDTCQT